jgi:hypothetical protein
MADDTSADPNAQPATNPYASLAAGLLNGPNYLNPAYATPAQKAELYKYAAELMKPQPVHNWAQGIGEVARSVVGGYEAHQADVQEQASAANAAKKLEPFGEVVSPQGGAQPSAGTQPGGGLPPNASSYAPAGASDAGDVPTSAAHFYTENGVTNPLGAAALAGNTQVESGYKPYAINHGDGRDGSDSVNIGQWNGACAQAFNKYAADHGLNPNDPKTGMAFQAQELHSTEAPSLAALNAARTPEEANAAALGYYRPAGYSSKDPTHSAGYNDRLDYTKQIAAALMAPNGMLANASSFTGSTPQIPAAHQEIANALLNRSPQPAPTRMAQNGMPVSPQAYAAVMADPNISGEVKHMANELVHPQIYETATGQMVPSYQYQPAGAPIVNKGVRVDQTPNSVPAIIGGNPNAPTNTVVPPQVAGQPSSIAQPGALQPGQSAAQIFSPSGVMGQMRQGQAQTDAQVAATAAKSAAAQQRFQKTQEEGPMLIAASYPLRQIQGLIEKNGGVLPSGSGAESVMGKESLANMIGSALGHPLTSEDSNLTTLELLKKYGVQVAGAQAQSLNVHPTNLGLETAEHTSPGTSLSGPANMHLVDNLVRLNDLAQRKTNSNTIFI